MSEFIQILTGVSLLLGSFLGITGAIGLIRFPDFYSRMHAAGITDTLCATLIIFGLMLQTKWDLALVKLIIILLFIFFINPTASHALAKAALHGGLKPKVIDQQREN
ncbi:Na(+) H(+) antiporter subunit G [hydrothermal vent metagenome]|uniref:Na(+) H(+) antiporter subunit G n=1 Tax=hydrothermal vent metagenome TaxID=652676 RepID=A0A3B0ZN61_9ZZZZ